MALRYLGYGTTNSNGVATLEKDPDGEDIDGYTGVGAGEVDFIAKCTIDDSTVVSQPYEVWDTLFYDDGVTDPKTVNWYNQGNYFTVTPSADGTLVSLSQTTIQAFFVDGTTYSNSYKFSGNLCVEVEILSNTSDNCYFTIMSNKNPQIPLNGAGIYKMTLNGTTVTKYKDGEVIGTTTDVSSQPVAVGFRVDNSGSFKFKDFKVYPI